MARLAGMLGPSEDAPAAPISLGRYRLLRQVAAGASGRVFEAEDRQLGRRVAVKLLSESEEAQGRGERLGIPERIREH